MTNPTLRTLPVTRRSPHLPEDIDLAARCAVPVLVTAPRNLATAIVHAIAATAGSHDRSKITIRKAPGGADAARRVAAHSGDGSQLIWISDVDLMDTAEQRALSRLLREWRRSGRAAPRIVASSTVDLYARIDEDEFDRELFYQLNTIHIVEPG